MLSRWYTATVLLFWVATMSWLVVNKVLPPVLIGDPPTYRTIVDDFGGREAQIVAWDVYLDTERIGTAESKTEKIDDDVTRFENKVSLSRLPWAELSPIRLGALSGIANDDPTTLGLETESFVEVDPLGRLTHFEVALRLGGLPERIILQGEVEGAGLQLSVRSGDFAYHTTAYLPPDSIVGDMFSPQQRLPNLRVGQAWTVPVYNPFRPATSPMEVLMARVVREEIRVWNGRAIYCWVVDYRPDDGAGLQSERPPQATLWVARDGTVVAQVTALATSTLRFERTTPAADVIAKEL